jgi:hypothetical protein
MTYRRFALPLIVLIAALLSVTIAVAQTGNGYDLTWSTVNGGGGAVSGGGYALDLTLGQPDAGTQNGGGYVLQGGFWGGVSAGPTPTLNHWLYLPVLQK